MLPSWLCDDHLLRLSLSCPPPNNLLKVALLVAVGYSRSAATIRSRRRKARVGWVERSETHAVCRSRLAPPMGYRSGAKAPSLNPSYDPRFSKRKRRPLQGAFCRCQCRMPLPCISACFRRAKSVSGSVRLGGSESWKRRMGRAKRNPCCSARAATSADGFRSGANAPALYPSYEITGDTGSGRSRSARGGAATC